MLDCLIIGGGPAGLTAAIYLARYRRQGLVVDAGESRAALIPESHNYPGFQGIAGPALLERLRARTVILATGLVDKKPDTEGLREGIAHGAIRFCPICDGYEATDKRIGVLGPFDTAGHKALFMRTYSRDVRLFPTDGARETALTRALDEAGVTIAGVPT